MDGNPRIIALFTCGIEVVIDLSTAQDDSLNALGIWRIGISDSC